MLSTPQRSYVSSASSPERGGWVVHEETFEAEESEFICDGEQNPLQPDRTSELALESWNLKKTVIDLNAQICSLRGELRTQKNLTKNLQNINSAVQKENTVRARENISLKSTITGLQKKIDELNTLNVNSNNNVNRHKRVASSLQTKINETEKSTTARMKEKDAIIAESKSEIELLRETLKTETTRLNDLVSRLTADKDRLEGLMQTLTRKDEELESENVVIKSELQRAKQQVNDAATFLNKELEKAFESMHSKLESAVAKKDEYRLKLMEYDYEKDQILAYMLSEGLQMPRLTPLNATQAREKLRIENLSYL